MDSGQDLINEMVEKLKEGFETPQEITDKYCTFTKPGLRDSFINQLHALFEQDKSLDIFAQTFGEGITESILGLFPTASKDSIDELKKANVECAKVMLINQRSVDIKRAFWCFKNVLRHYFTAYKGSCEESDLREFFDKFKAYMEK